MTQAKRPALALMTLCLMAAATLMLYSGTGAVANTADETLRVGTYQPQHAFEQYHATQGLHQEAARLQAQAEQNPDQMQQIQMQFQQMQQQVITQFQQDLEVALPEIAQQAKVDIVAVQVLYTAPGIEVQDLTSDVIATLNEGQSGAQPAQRPGMP